LLAAVEVAIMMYPLFPLQEVLVVAVVVAFLVGLEVMVQQEQVVVAVVVEVVVGQHNN
jgi:hypothetical protein